MRSGLVGAPFAAPRVVLVLVIFVASACDADHGADQAEDEQRPDGSSGTSATGEAGIVAGSGGAGGASDTGGRGGTSGSGETPAIDGGEADASGSAGTTGAGGTGRTDAGSGDCPTGLEGPALVNVPAPAESAVSSYCVDATEVTNAQYAAFLAASVETSGQDEACAWNASYTPPSDWPATGKEDYPVAYVDWCDAYAYCKWAGKHLCGKIGGGANRFDFDFEDATKSEWFNACSAGGTSTYPYGDYYDGTACVGLDYDEAGYQPASDVARRVATETCEGGYGGLHDLSGNVWEWEDSCTGEALAHGCRLRGGASNSDTMYLACASSYDRERDFVNPSVGFRCCAGAEAGN